MAPYPIGHSATRPASPISIIPIALRWRLGHRTAHDPVLRHRPPARRARSAQAAGGAARCIARAPGVGHRGRSEEHTSELQSLMRISYAVFCLKKKTNINMTNRDGKLKEKRKHKHKLESIHQRQTV